MYAPSNTGYKRLSCHNGYKPLWKLCQDFCTSAALETQYLNHTTHNFKWSRYTLTTLRISQLQTVIYLLETGHPSTTKQMTRTYNIAFSTSQTYHTQSSPEMWTRTPLSGKRTLMTTEDR